MKKSLVAGIMSAVMLFSLAACGSKDADSAKVELGQYKGIALTRVSESQVTSEINNAVSSLAEYVSVDRAAADGDTVNIDFVGKRDGVAFEGGSSEAFDLVLGSHRFIDGFEDGLIGTKAGETKDLNLTFPDPYPNNEELAGQPVVFTVTVNSVKELVTPELTDELVKEHFSVNTVAEYRQNVTDALNKAAFQEQIGNALMESCKVENLPADQVKEVADSFYNMYIQYAEMYSQYFGTDSATILASLFGFESVDALRTYADQYATKSVSYMKIIEEIGKVEKIEPSQAELETRGAVYATEYGYDSYAALCEGEGEDTVKDAITMDLVIEFIIDQAVISDAQ